jgi:predicted MarR family transcription regulator
VTMQSQKPKMPGAQRIVSSAHLAANELGALSEFEFALTMVVNAYHRWMARCMVAAAAGASELGPLDVLVLHHLNHRDRPKRLADLCLVLNVEDSHTVNYALKKLAKLGLAVGVKRGKEVFHAATAEGKALCERYRAVREQCLIEALTHLGQPNHPISEAAALMRALSGIYDQAARAAASL